MKKYNIKVNGKAYEVEVETAGSDGALSIPASKPSVKTEPADKPAPKAIGPQGNAGAIKIEAPMPGTILKVNVKSGDAVKEGQVLCVLEAMKMENEICAPQDATVATINVSTGATVESGALLVSLN